MDILREKPIGKPAEDFVKIWLNLSHCPMSRRNKLGLMLFTKAIAVQCVAEIGPSSRFDEVAAEIECDAVERGSMADCLKTNPA